MPLDAAPLALPAYEQAYVREWFAALMPGAARARSDYIYVRTNARWQVEMAFSVEASGVHDPAMPAYERAYVAEFYNSLLPAADAAFNQYILTRTPWYWQDEMAVLLLAFNGPTESDVQSWVIQLTINGAPVSALRQKIVSQFVRAEKDAGTWALTDEYWAFWAENPVQALTSIKQRRLATAVASPIFGTNRGWASDGASSYVNLGLVPGSHMAIGGIDNCRLSVYELTPNTGTRYALGCSLNASNAMTVRPCTDGVTGNVNGGAMCSSTNSPGPPLTGVGYTTMVRRGPLVTDAGLYRDAAPRVFSPLPTSMGTTVPTIPLYLCALNGNGTVSGWRTATEGFAAIGAALNDAQEMAHFRNVRMFGQMVGAL